MAHVKQSKFRKPHLLSLIHILAKLWEEYTGRSPKTKRPDLQPSIRIKYEDDSELPSAKIRSYLRLSEQKEDSDYNLFYEWFVQYSTILIQA